MESFCSRRFRTENGSAHSFSCAQNHSVYSRSLCLKKPYASDLEYAFFIWAAQLKQHLIKRIVCFLLQHRSNLRICLLPQRFSCRRILFCCQTCIIAVDQLVSLCCNPFLITLHMEQRFIIGSVRHRCDQTARPVKVLCAETPPGRVV